MKIRWYQLWWLWLFALYFFILACCPEILPFNRTERNFIGGFCFILVNLLALRLACKVKPDIVGTLQPIVFTAITIGIMSMFIGAEFLFPISKRVLVILYILGIVAGSGFLIYGYCEFKQTPSFVRFLPVAIILLFLFMQICSLFTSFFFYYQIQGN